MNTSACESVPVSATEPSAQPEAAPPWPRWATAVPVSLTLLLAVVLAAVPVRDSAVWQHLATGRALLNGTYTLGTDPFAYTTDGAAWVNHSWLYDVALYGIYQVAGSNLGVVPPLLAAGLVVLMLLVARPGLNPWRAAFAVALGLVVLGPHLALSPHLASYALFGVVILCLDRLQTCGRCPSLTVTLLAACLVWVNCDDWFLLGPAAVTIFALVGSLTAAPKRRTLLTIAVLSFAVCLLNPHHFRAFVVPAELEGAPLSAEPHSPLNVVTTGALAALPVPVAAYFLLLALACIAALGAGKRPLWPHLALFACLAALSLIRSGAVPFFAITAATLLARGWQSAAQRAAPRRLAHVGPVVVTIGLVGLVVSACPGWLQGTGAQRGWFLDDDASLRSVAQRLGQWRETGRLGERTRGFPCSADAAHYLEWFCPGVKVFADSRPHLYPANVLSDFQDAHRALAQDPTQPALVTVQPILARWDVGYLVVSDPVERTLVAALWHLWQAPDDWQLVALDGKATIFAARPQPPGAEPLNVAPVDLHRFTPSSAVTNPTPALPTAAAPEDHPWWDCLAYPESAGAQLGRDEALVYLAHFEALQPAYARRHFFAWQVKLALAALAPAGAGGSTATGAAMPMALLAGSQRPMEASAAALLPIVQRSVAMEQMRGDDGPPASLFSAVQAARHALADDPNDALAYLRLGHAYERLDTRTVERAAAPEFPLLSELRRVQAITALKTAVRLRPDLVPAHQLLVGVYERAGALDLAWEHLREQVRVTRAQGPRPGESRKDYEVRADFLAAREQKLGREVRERINLATTRSFNLNAFGKARVADSVGLPGQALKLLQGSNYGEFGVEGAVIQVHLLFYAGHAREAQSWMEPAQERTMGTFNYQWLQAVAAAALGDYAAADHALQHLRTAAIDLPDFNLHQIPLRTAIGLLFGQQLLQAASFGPGTRRDPSDMLRHRLVELTTHLRQQADADTLRGLLALERGAVETARQELRAALAIWQGREGSAAIARHYLDLIGR